jgi:hypothetical protein
MLECSRPCRQDWISWNCKDAAFLGIGESVVYLKQLAGWLAKDGLMSSNQVLEFFPRYLRRFLSGLFGRLVSPSAFTRPPGAVDLCRKRQR